MARRTVMEAAGSTQVPFDLVESSVCKHLGRDTLNIVDCDIVPIETAGFSGNDFYRAVVSLREEQRTRSISLIVKRWLPTAWTALLTGAKTSRESLAWENGLFAEQSLPDGLRVPFIETRRDSDGAWIVMEEISSEFAAFNSPTGKRENTQFLLDRLARFHVLWERSERLSQLQGYRWLYSQEARLHWGVDCHLKWLGKEYTEVADRERLRQFKTSCPDSVEWARPAVTAFLESVPHQDRDLWKKHVCNRDVLVEALDEYPQVLLHGDLTHRNVGIRRGSGDSEVYIIDWEWARVGAPVLDVVYLLYHFYLVGGNDPQAADDADELKEFYFGRYIAYGGQNTGRKEWHQSCDLAHIYLGLSHLTVHAGSALLRAKRQEDVAWVTRETERVTETMRRVFG
jgi:hypothetical protein